MYISYIYVIMFISELKKIEGLENKKQMKKKNKVLIKFSMILGLVKHVVSVEETCSLNY